MPRLTQQTPVGEALKDYPGVAGVFGARGVTTLGDLKRLTLADWWRSARAGFSTLVDAAARARVQPSDDAHIALIWRGGAGYNVSDGLKMTGDPKLAAIADLLAAAGVTSLMLLLRLKVLDLKSISGIGDDEVRLIQAWLETTVGASPLK